MKHIVGFSGGIDSQACAGLVLDKYGPDDVILLNTSAGENEHEITTEFIRWYSDNVHPVITVPALVSDLWAHDGLRVHVSEKKAREKGYLPEQELKFGDMMLLKGRGPSSQAQFCTEILKLRPIRRWLKENMKDDFERYTGVRRDESENRKNTPDREWDKFFDCYVNHIVAGWAKVQCFLFVQERGEKYNPLYLKGFLRIGCAPCINCRKDEIELWDYHFPEVIVKVRGYETLSNRTFFPPIVPGRHINDIDDVVQWSKTEHGGRQYPLVPKEHTACESKYGLCE